MTRLQLNPTAGSTLGVAGALETAGGAILRLDSRVPARELALLSGGVRVPADGDVAPARPSVLPTRGICPGDPSV